MEIWQLSGRSISKIPPRKVCWLPIASYLDPRFRQHDLWSVLGLAKIKDRRAQAAFEHWEKYPELMEKLKVAASNPLNYTLDGLAREASSSTRVRGRGRGRGSRGRGRGRAASLCEEPKSAAEIVMKQDGSEGLTSPPIKKAGKSKERLPLRIGSWERRKMQKAMR